MQGGAMARKRFDVEIPDGLRLGFSHGVGGAFKAHLFDRDNKLVGHANLFEPEDEYVMYSNPIDSDDGRGRNDRQSQSELSDEDLEQLVTALIGLSLFALAAAQRISIELPKLRSWWQLRARPVVKALIGKRPRINFTRRRVLENDQVNDLRDAFEDYRAKTDDIASRQKFVDLVLSRLPQDSIHAESLENNYHRDAVKLPKGRALARMDRNSIGEQLTGILKRNPQILQDQSLKILQEVFVSQALGSAPVRMEIDT